MAQSQLYTKKAQVFVTEETSQDTYETQAAGDGFLAEVPDEPLQLLGDDHFRPGTVRGDGLSPDLIPGGTFVQIPLRVPIKGSGTAGTAPEYGEALKACGYEEVTVASTSVTYNPLLTFDGTGGNPGPSYSVTILEDGVAYKARGAFGNVSFSSNGGEPMYADFLFTGGFVAVAADALETVTYQTTNAPAMTGVTFSTNLGGSYTPKGTESFTLDTGNNVTAMRDIADTYGFYGARITSRSSFGSFDPEMVAVATHDYFGKALAGTTGTASCAVGGTAGNICTITLGRIQYGKPSMRNKEGVRALTVPYTVSSAATDAEGTNLDISIAFT